MPKQSSCWSLSCAALLVAIVPTLGCGAEPIDASRHRGRRASGALTAGQSYLVSFTSGGIPANASSLVAAAGGTIVARYNAVGVVLARSASTSFARQAARDVGHRRRRQRRRGSQRDLARREEHGASARPHKIVQPAGGDPLSPAPVGHGRRFTRRRPARSPAASRRCWSACSIRASTSPTRISPGASTRAPARRCLGGVANPAQAVWATTIRSATARSRRASSAPRRTTSASSASRRASRLAMVKVAVDDFNDPNVGLVFPDAFVCAIDWAIAHDWDLVNASLTIDPFTAPIDDIFCSDQPDRAAIVKIVRRAILEAGRNKIDGRGGDRQSLPRPREPAGRGRRASTAR